MFQPSKQYEVMYFVFMIFYGSRCKKNISLNSIN
jgi:hypothetical protein